MSFFVPRKVELYLQKWYKIYLQKKYIDIYASSEWVLGL